MSAGEHTALITALAAVAGALISNLAQAIMARGKARSDEGREIRQELRAALAAAEARIERLQATSDARISALEAEIEEWRGKTHQLQSEMSQWRSQMAACTRGPCPLLQG